MTPERSQYNPPSAAKIKGVAKRRVEAMSVKLKMFRNMGDWKFAICDQAVQTTVSLEI
jgi:hypothetical protein